MQLGMATSRAALMPMQQMMAMELLLVTEVVMLVSSETALSETPALPCS